MRWFLRLAGATLLLTGFAKIISSFGDPNLYYSKDPLLQATYHDLFLIGGGAEVAIGIICLASNRILRNAVIIATFSIELLVYRIGVAWVGGIKPCSCVGDFAEKLHISDAQADWLMRFILAGLLIGSFIVVVRCLLEQRAAGRVNLTNHPRDPVA